MPQPDARPGPVQPPSIGANMSVALPPRDASPRLLTAADQQGGGGSSHPVDAATFSSDRKAVDSNHLLPSEGPLLLSSSDGNIRSGNTSPGEKKLDDGSTSDGGGGADNHASNYCGAPQQEGAAAAAAAAPSSSGQLQSPETAEPLNTQFKLSLADMKPNQLQIEEESPAVTIITSNRQAPSAGTATGTSAVAGGVPSLPVMDHPTRHGHQPSIGFTANPYDRPYCSSQHQVDAGSGSSGADAYAVGSPSKPPDITYSHRQMAMISPLHAPMEVLGENDQIPDIPLINSASQDNMAAATTSSGGIFTAAGRSPHSSVNSLSTPASSLGSQSASLLSSVATPPGYILAGNSASGRYYRSSSAATAAQKPRVYSAIGSLESLTSPSSLSAKIMASQQQQQQYQRLAAGSILPPANLRSTSTSTVNGTSGGIVVGGSAAAARCATANISGGDQAGGSNQPSLLTQAEKKGDLQHINQDRLTQVETKDRSNSATKTDEDPGKGSSERRRSKGKLKSSLRRHSSDVVSDTDNTRSTKATERRKRSGKKKSKKKSVKIDTTSTRVIPPKPAEMFRPSCDAYTPRMGRKKIEYKPAEHRTPVQKMSGSMGTISRPNFRDALRRVAMIIQQHVVKIERRFESGVHGADDTGLFRQSMREAFAEDNFVTPRYKCTVLRLPMGRPGVIYGHRKIKVEYKAPTVEEIYDFGHQLFKAVQLSSECSIVCLIYVERLMEVAKVPLLADTWKPIFMAGLLLASKVWQDLSSWNIEFASVYPQFSLDSINRLELQFLKSVKWDLYISSSLYAKYYFALRSLLEKQDFRQKYARMTGVGGVTASEAMKVQKRTERVKEEALIQLSRSM